MKHLRVEEYTYLGQTISRNKDHENEIRKKIGMRWSVFALLMNTVIS